MSALVSAGASWKYWSEMKLVSNAAENAADRIQRRPRRHAAKLDLVHRCRRQNRTRRVGHRRGFRAVAGDDARHVRAVAVGVHQTLRRVANNAGRGMPPAVKSGCCASMPVSFTSTIMFVPVKFR